MYPFPVTYSRTLNVPVQVMEAIPAADRIIILRQGPPSFHMRARIYTLRAYMFAQVRFAIFIKCKQRNTLSSNVVLVHERNAEIFGGDQLIYMLSALHSEK